MLCRGKIRVTQHEMHQMKNTGNYNTPHQKLNSYKKNKSERNVSMSTLDFDIKEKDMSMINDPLYDLNAMPLIHVSAEFMRFFRNGLGATNGAVIGEKLCVYTDLS